MKEIDPDILQELEAVIGKNHLMKERRETDVDDAQLKALFSGAHLETIRKKMRDSGLYERVKVLDPELGKMLVWRRKG
jgi:hypothetical protein